MKKVNNMQIQNSFEKEFEIKKIKENEINKMRTNSSIKDYKILQQKINLRRL